MDNSNVNRRQAIKVNCLVITIPVFFKGSFLLTQERVIRRVKGRARITFFHEHGSVSTSTATRTNLTMRVRGRVIITILRHRSANLFIYGRVIKVTKHKERNLVVKDVYDPVFFRFISAFKRPMITQVVVRRSINRVLSRLRAAFLVTLPCVARRFLITARANCGRITMVKSSQVMAITPANNALT